MPSFDPFGLAVTAVAGMIFASVWWLLLRYYRRLSKAKWDVINKLEMKLPVQPFTDEWKAMYPDETLTSTGGELRKKQRSHGLRHWWRHAKHREATAVEQIVPIVFVVVYFVLLLRVALQ